MRRCIIVWCCCFFFHIANGASSSSYKKENAKRNENANNETENFIIQRNFIQRKPASLIKRPIIVRQSWKKVNILSNVVKKPVPVTNKNTAAKNSLFKRWPLRSPYDVMDSATRKECIETNQEQNKDSNVKIKPAFKDTKQGDTLNLGQETTKVEVEEKDDHEQVMNKKLKKQDQDMNDFLDNTDDKTVSMSTKEIAIQRLKKEEEAQKILHSDQDDVTMVNYHKQKKETNDGENEKDSRKNEDKKFDSLKDEEENIKQKSRNKDKELKMKAMKLRLKDEDNFEDQIKTVENDLKEENKDPKNRGDADEKSTSNNVRVENKPDQSLENSFKSDKEHSPQNIQEMKDEANPQRENEENKLRKEMMKSKSNYQEKNDNKLMDSKLLQDKLSEQSIDHSMKTNPRPEENTAEIEDALITGQPHKIQVINQEKIKPQLTPMVLTAPSPQFNQYHYEHNVDNQFFKLWREDLLIKQKFIERMTNMDTKYLGLLYKISKSLDSISHTLTSGFKEMNSVLGEQLNTADIMDKHYPPQQPQMPPQKPNNGMNYF